MELTISNRSRSLAVSWSNQPVQRYNDYGEGHLEIDDPGVPEHYGSLRQCQRELATAGRLNSGNDWTWALFVRCGGERNGRLVEAYWGTYTDYSQAGKLGYGPYAEDYDNAHWYDYLTAKQQFDDEYAARVRTCQGWLRAGRMPAHLLATLAAGIAVRVRLED